MAEFYYNSFLADISANLSTIFLASSFNKRFVFCCKIFIYNRLLINKIFPEVSINLKMLADVFRGRASGKTLRGWKVLHAAMCWRTQNGWAKLSIPEPYSQRRWDKLTKKVGGLSKIKIPLTLCIKTLTIIILTFINFNNSIHNTTLLSLNFSGFFCGFLSELGFVRFIDLQDYSEIFMKYLCQ